MRKGDSTREAIVGRALTEAVQVGLEGLTLGGLAESLSLSKSGLFAHFKSKEALQLAVMDEAVVRFQKRVIVPSLKAKNGRARLDALFKHFLLWIKGESDLGGCPFLVFAQEYANRPGALRARVVAIQKEWQDFVGTTAVAAIAAGEFERNVEPAQFAFEFVGIGLAYQRAIKLMGDRSALSRSNAAYRALVERAVV